VSDEATEEIAFECVRDGGIFKLGNPCIIGRTRYFVVGDAQKAAIADRLRSSKRDEVLTAIFAPVIAVSIGANLPLHTLSPCTALLLAAFSGFIFFCAVSVVELYKLPPLISSLPHANVGELRASYVRWLTSVFIRHVCVRRGNDGDYGEAAKAL
jgi:hypothetical protein